MKKLKNKFCSPIEFDTIFNATMGDTDSINLVLNYYESYINRLSSVSMFDSFGKKKSYIDEELKQRLQTKLIVKILSFEVTK